MKFAGILSAIFLTGPILQAAASTGSACTYTSCGSANEWCASGARDAILARLGCDLGTLTNFVRWSSPMVMDAWYKDSPCAARFSAQGNSYIQCYGLNVPYQWVINDCYVNGNNGLGSYTMKGDLKVTISACAGIWSKKRNEIDPEDNIDLNNLRELKTLTKREEVADIVGDLISGAIKTEKNHVVDGTSVFGLPFSRSEAMSVCEIARYSESSELAKKYGCSS